MFTFLTQAIFNLHTCHLTHYKKVKLSLCSSKHQTMKIKGRLKAQLHKFLTSTLRGKNHQLHIPASLSPRVKVLQYHLDRRLRSQSGPSGEKIPAPAGNWAHHPPLSQSLHWSTNLIQNEFTFLHVNIQQHCIYWIERENINVLRTANLEIIPNIIWYHECKWT